MISDKANNLLHNNMKTNWINDFAFWSVGAIAFSINFGVALVSISSLLIVIASLLKLISHQTHSTPTIYSTRPKLTICVIPLAIFWMMVTGLWTVSDLQNSAIQLMRYSRLLVIPIIYFLVRDADDALKILKIWIYGQIFVIFSSYMLWLGAPLPWTSNPHATLDLTPYTSTLEQPIMNTIMLVIIWHFREHFSKLWGKLTVNIILIAIIFEVFFIMQGRTGYICMLLTLTFITWRSLSSNLKILAIMLPCLIVTVVYNTSSTFERRISEVVKDVKSYNDGIHVSNQGNRIDFTMRSIDAVKVRPILGFGVGSWPIAYRYVRGGSAPTEVINGVVKELKADNPHEQFLLWFVEGGVVAFAFLIGIYYSIYKDSKKLRMEARYALQLILVIITFASFLNCPFHGAGMSEFLGFTIAVLLCIPKIDSSAENTPI